MRFERITTDPKVMGGAPCIRGVRVPVATVVAMVAEGMSTEEILDDLPHLEKEDICEALRYAAEVRRSLSEAEVGTLMKLVDAAPPQFAPLRQQIAAAVVTGHCHCGCATIEIAVDESRAEPVAGAYTGALPVEANLRLPDRQFAEGVVVMLYDGWLAGLEVYGVNDAPVREFPGPEQLEVLPADPGETGFLRLRRLKRRLLAQRKEPESPGRASASSSP
jgi:uncharacterized protein (DUF433 family)